MDRKELIEKYRNCLCYLCRQSAFLEDTKRRMQRGEIISVKKLSLELAYMERAKRDLLSLKDQLGFDGGLDFMDDVKFQGFQFKDGELSGDYTNLITIISPWIATFDERKIYSYEVGILILFHYMKQTGKDGNNNVSVGKIRSCLCKAAEWLRKFWAGRFRSAA